MNSKELFSYFKAHQAKFTNLLKELVSFQTYSLEVENLNRFVHYLENVFKELKLASTRYYTENGDLISFVLNPEQSDFIVLLAHMDTVKVSETLEPIRIEKNRLYGNGVYDMKNAIALFCFTMKAIRELAIQIDKQVKIILNPDEEVGSSASKSILLKECANAKAVIVPEPSCPDGGVKIRRKGVVVLNMTVKGRAAHSGIEPEKGRDANRGLVQLIQKIDSIVGKFHDITFNPGIIAGGRRINVVSPESTLQGELRGYDNNALKDAVHEIGKIKKIVDLGIKTKIVWHHRALEYNEKNQRLYAIAKGIAAELNYKLPTCATGGASDGSSLSAAGIPVIDGLGMRGNGAHSIGEYVDLADFPFRATLITRLCQEI